MGGFVQRLADGSSLSVTWGAKAVFVVAIPAPRKSRARNLLEANCSPHFYPPSIGKSLATHPLTARGKSHPGHSSIITKGKEGSESLGSLERKKAEEAG